MALIEGALLGVGEGQEAFAAAMLLLRRYLVLYLKGLCAGTLGVAEHVQRGDIQRLNEAVGLLEMLLHLATRTYDDVDTDEGMGHEGAYLFYLGGEKRRVVAATHELEHSIAARLQGDMEVGHEGTRTGHELDDLIGEQVGLDGGDAVALDTLHPIQGADEVDEGLACRLTEISDIDTSDDNLLGSLGSGLTGLLHQ